MVKSGNSCPWFRFILSALQLLTNHVGTLRFATCACQCHFTRHYNHSMDVRSPEHLERLRDQPEIKAALFRFQLTPTASEARFERARKNTLYWPPIDALSARFLATGRAQEIREDHQLYGRPCLLLATSLASSPHAPYVIALAAADGAPVETLLALLRRVSGDYWHGSYFFK